MSALVSMAIVGMLLEGDQEQSGYALHRRFGTAFLGSGPLNIGQVYLTLGRLCAADLAECVAVRHRGGRVSKHYAPLSAASPAVRAWLGVDTSTAREDWFRTVEAKLVVATMVGFDQQTVCRSHRAALLRDAASLPPGPTSGCAIALARHRAGLQARLDWLDAIAAESSRS